ncbi:MAG: GNAT family N-acetyltransferase [Firmicutes bacterium]|nr:GNAT family N-acetyltransferase [Bacillota bacterium]
MDKNIKIINLASEPKFVEQVAKWLYDEWDTNDGRNYADALYRTKHSMCKDRVPQTYIAVLGGELVGTVHIWNNDLKCRQDLTPWIAALYVKEKHRGKGIGTALQLKCIEAVRKMGYPKLYLITDHENYYEKTGWEFLETAPLMGEKTTRIYQFDISMMK